MGYDRDTHGEAGRRDQRGEDRGFFDRAGDEVRSWFGDEEAERRRREDERYDERGDRERYAAGDRGGYSRPSGGPGWYRSNQDDFRRGGAGYAGQRAGGGYDDRASLGQDRYGEGYPGDGGRSYGYRGDGDRGQARDRSNRYGDRMRGHDRDVGRHDRGRDEHGYGDWRDRQMSAFDRDYEEFRREHQSRFETEFTAWRENRQTQRAALDRVKEHQEVVGSDGQHVGTVDHVRSDNILLTRNDRDAGGHHHSIPSSWIAIVDDKVKLSRTADEAKRAWREADERGGLFGDRDDGPSGGRGQLRRSFGGTY